MRRLKINRWAYLALVLLTSVVTGLTVEFRSPVAMVLVLALPALTFPLGVVGSLVTLPLIYTGIVTVSESYVVAAPFSAIAGMLQWYYIFPRLFSSNRAVNRTR